MFCASEASHGRYAAIMIDADNGKVLHEVDATQSWYPASLTKLMTLYMTFEALKNGQIHFFDAMRTSSYAARQPTSKLGLRTGEYLTVRDAILALITRSANDAAVVLAEHIGGTEQIFAVKMTEQARDLGMHNTRFMNATGLPNEWQVTTSRDMAVLAWNIQRHYPEYYQYFSAHGFNYKGTELRGINKFVAHYPGAEGMKTGFTCGSGYNLIASAYQNGKRLIGVILGGMTSAERYQLMYRMMDAGFDNRYDGNQEKHINSMPAGIAGPPPYQLSCGSRAFLHQASTYKTKSYRETSKTFVKRVSSRKSKLTHKTVKNKKTILKSGHGKRKIIKKSTSITRSSQNSRHTLNKKGSRLSGISVKHKKTIKNTKISKTGYRHRNAT